MGYGNIFTILLMRFFCIAKPYLFSRFYFTNILNSLNYKHIYMRIKFGQFNSSTANIGI